MPRFMAILTAQRIGDLPPGPASLALLANEPDKGLKLAVESLAATRAGSLLYRHVAHGV